MEIETRGAPAHTRTLSVGLHEGAGGRVAARGAILDLRKRGLVPMAGDLQTNGVIHHMRVDAVLSRPGLVIEEISAEQPSVAFEPAPGTGGECCRDPVRRIEALSGTPLDAAFAKRLGGAIGGPLGCSHVLTLAQLLGSTARTALEADASRYGEGAARPEGLRLFQRSLSIDGLEDGDRGLVLSLQLCDVHFTPVSHAQDPLARLAAQREIRIGARVDLGGMAIAEIAGAERDCDAASLDSAAWTPRDLSFLAGHPALSGMARTLFEKLPDAPETRPWLDALLNLAPAVIQCIPALTSHWRRWREAAAQGGAGSGGPAMMAGGGMVDSCYMWRRDGFMSRRMAQTMGGLRRRPDARAGEEAGQE